MKNMIKTPITKPYKLRIIPTVTIEPTPINNTNAKTKKKKNDIKLSLKNKKPTIPSTIADEIKGNIFFRVNDPDIKKAINLENSPDIEIFTKLRDLKDNF